MTLGERIARLEALVTAGAKNDAEFRAEVREGLKEIRESFKEHKEKTDADEAALAALKNKGIGLLIGVGVGCSAGGASLSELLSGLFK